MNLLLQAALIQLVFLAFPILYLKLKDKLSWNKILKFLTISKKPEKLISRSLLVFFAAFLSIIVLSAALSIFNVNDDSQKVADKVTQNPLEFIVAGLLLSPIAEEVFFRGFLLKKIGFLPSAILFALSHFGYGSYVEIAGAFAIALIFSYFAEKYKDIKPLMAGHFLLNLVSLSISLL